MHSLFELGLFS